MIFFEKWPRDLNRNRINGTLFCFSRTNSYIRHSIQRCWTLHEAKRMDNYELEYPSPEQITLPPFTAQSRPHVQRNKNKIWEVKKRFTRENKNKQSKTRFSAFFHKMPYYKNKFIVKTISGCFCIICSRHYQSIFQNFVNLLKLSRVRYFASSWNRNIAGVRTSCSHGNSIRIQCLGMHFSWFSNVGWSDT